VSVRLSRSAFGAAGAPRTYNRRHRTAVLLPRASSCFRHGREAWAGAGRRDGLITVEVFKAPPPSVALRQRHSRRVDPVAKRRVTIEARTHSRYSYFVESGVDGILREDHLPDGDDPS